MFGRVCVGAAFLALAVVVLSGCSLFSDGGDSGVAGVEDEFGYNEGWADSAIGSDPDVSTEVRRRLVQLSADGGATTNEIPVRWALVQPGEDLATHCQKRPSEQPAEHWGGLDEAYSEMLDAGIRPLLVVGDAPCWAAQPPGAGSPVTQCDPAMASYPPAPAFYDEWQRFVGHVAARYPDALGIEIGNEPNVPLFWGGCDTKGQGATYGELLRRGYDAVKAEETEMPVVTAGMAPNWDPGPYLEDVFAYGNKHRGSDGALPWDAVAVHAYRARKDLAAGRSFADSATHELDVVRAAEGTQDVDDPLWVTEVGASTVSETPSNPNDPHDPLLVHGSNPDQAQAKALVEIYRRLVEEGVSVVIVSRFVDTANDPDQPPREQGAGVLRADFTPKPAYAALARQRGALKSDAR
jgi:hypothetical protein